MNRLLLPAVFLLGSTAACATLLDFQEPTDRVTTADGTEGVDAHVPSETIPAEVEQDDASVAPEHEDASAVPDANADADADADTTLPPVTTTLPPVTTTLPPVTTTLPPVTTTLPPVTTTPPPVTCTSCIPHASSGWRGPFVVAQGTNDLPECIGDYPVSAYAGHAGLSADPAQCSCVCGSASGISCSVPTTSFFTDPKCATTACRADTSTHACGEKLSCDVSSSKVMAAMVSGSTPTGGHCAPSATTKVSAAQWQKTIQLCAPRATEADCTGGVCQPTPSPTFESKNRCVIQDGNVAACPSAFPVRQVFYSGGHDTRTCSACTCGDPQGASCSATVAKGFCSAPTMISAPTGCVQLSQNERISVGSGVLRGNPTCTPNGGQPIGAFDPGAATTVCCLE